MIERNITNTKKEEVIIAEKHYRVYISKINNVTKSITVNGNDGNLGQRFLYLSTNAKNSDDSTLKDRVEELRDLLNLTFLEMDSNES